MQDVKMTEQVSRHEIVRHENAGYGNAECENHYENFSVQYLIWLDAKRQVNGPNIYHAYVMNYC